MEQFEKVEKLRERANVTYEEARDALVACDWDLLDAMVYLEKLGKVSGPDQANYTTSYEGSVRYESVRDKIDEQKGRTQEGLGDKLRRLFRRLIDMSKDNFFRVVRQEDELIKVPVWTFVLALLICWQAVLIVMVISLFFGCRFSFEGKNNLEGANRVMEKASEVANEVKDKIKEEYDKL